MQRQGLSRQLLRSTEIELPFRVGGLKRLCGRIQLVHIMHEVRTAEVALPTHEGETIQIRLGATPTAGETNEEQVCP